jgi:hypothetical protein
MAKKETPVKVKLTPEQRAAKRLADAKARKDLEAAAAAEFESNRSQIWLGMWVKALRIALAFGTKEPGHGLPNDFYREYDWWFERFSVDPLAQSFIVDGERVTESSIHPDGVDQIAAQLDGVFEWHAQHLEAKERERQEQLERQRRRETALSKLNEEDRLALGLR